MRAIGAELNWEGQVNSSCSLLFTVEAGEASRLPVVRTKRLLSLLRCTRDQVLLCPAGPSFYFYHVGREEVIFCRTTGDRRYD
jgi:hypothetical protein